MSDLTGLDLVTILDMPPVRNEVDRQVSAIMQGIFDSYTFGEVRKNRT